MTIKEIQAGELIVEHVPLFEQEAGTPPDLMVIWNRMVSNPSEIDLVLHLHGYSPSAASMNVAVEKRPISGLDFGDPDLPPGMTPSRSRPTLALMPRGRYFGGRTGYGYNFPTLMDRGGWPMLNKIASKAFMAKTGFTHMPKVGRKILTAHSGGGAGLMQVSEHFNPHEIHIFDALYSQNPALIKWVKMAIAADAAALAESPHMSPAYYMSRWGRALRVFYIAGSGTEAASLEVSAAIEHSLATQGRYGVLLAPWYQVLITAIEHALIPRRLGWQLLDDAGVGACTDS